MRTNRTEDEAGAWRPSAVQGWTAESTWVIAVYEKAIQVSRHRRWFLRGKCGVSEFASSQDKQGYPELLQGDVLAGKEMGSMNTGELTIMPGIL